MSQLLSSQKISHRDGSRIPELTLSELYKPSSDLSGKTYPMYIPSNSVFVDDSGVISSLNECNGNKSCVKRQNSAVKVHPRYLDTLRVGIADPIVYSILGNGLPLVVGIGHFQPELVSLSITEQVPVFQKPVAHVKTSQIGGDIYEDTVPVVGGTKIEIGKYAVNAAASVNASQPKMQSLSALLASSKKNAKDVKKQQYQQQQQQQQIQYQPQITAQQPIPRPPIPTNTPRVEETVPEEPLLFPLCMQAYPAISIPLHTIETYEDAHALFQRNALVCNSNTPLQSRIHEISSYSIAISATIEILHDAHLFSKQKDSTELQFLHMQFQNKAFWKGMLNAQYICKDAICQFSIQVSGKLLCIYVRVIDVYPGSSFLAQCSSLTNIKFLHGDEEEGKVEMLDEEMSFFQVNRHSKDPTMQRNVLDKRKQTSQDTLIMQETLISTPVLHSTQLKSSGLSLPSGVLLYGPPGVGKTWSVIHCLEQVQQTALHAAIGNTNALLPCLRFVSCDASGIMSMVPGESEKRMSRLFDHCRQQSCAIEVGSSNTDTNHTVLRPKDSLEFVNKDVLYPLTPYTGQTSVVVLETVLFLDEIDALCPKRDNLGQSLDTYSSRLVSHILTLLDGIEEKKGMSKTQAHVFVIAATNLPHNIDPAIRRSGRLDREICVFPPDEQARAALLKKMQARVDTSEIRLDLIANALVGFVGADITAFTRHILLQMQKSGETIVTVTHCINAAKQISAASLRGSSLTSLKKMDSIFEREDVSSNTSDFAPEQGGMEQIKLQLQQAIEWPLKHAETYRRLGVHPPKGILLYGPPGGGKTSIARALCANMKAAFFTLDVGSLYSCYLGEAEKLLRDLFTKARANTPAVVFLDEVDSIVGDRGLSGGTNDTGSRVLATLLNEMDGIEGQQGVLVLAATNRKDRLDAALLRPGRFDTKIEVLPPNATQCGQILRTKCANLPIHPDVDIDYVVKLALAHLGFKLSAATVAAVARDAALYAIKRAVQGGDALITMQDFKNALHVQ